MSANNSRLVVQNLQKSFKKRQVVKSFSLEIESGEVIGLLGPNGAGKTTSFYMIVGLIAADAGSVMLDGQELRHLPIHERARLGVGYLPQEASDFPQNDRGTKYPRHFGNQHEGQKPHRC